MCVCVRVCVCVCVSVCVCVCVWSVCVYLPSNGAIAIVAHRDFYIYFQVRKILNVKISKIVRVRKMVNHDFY